MAPAPLQLSSKSLLLPYHGGHLHATRPGRVTLIPGDVIRPLVTGATEQLMEATHAPLYFEKFHIHGDMKKVPEEVIESIRKNKVCLKGGLATPVRGGVSSLNVS